MDQHYARFWMISAAFVYAIGYMWIYWYLIPNR